MNNKINKYIIIRMLLIGLIVSLDIIASIYIIWWSSRECFYMACVPCVLNIYAAIFVSIILNKNNSIDKD